MIPLPWQSLSPADAHRRYLALLTYLPLVSFWRIPQFLRFVSQIRRQLQASGGVLGYALVASPLRKEFWTLSVWEDEAALMAFVHDAPHVQIMDAIAPHMGETKFVRWEVQGSGVPPTWREAFSRLRTP